MNETRAYLVTSGVSERNESYADRTGFGGGGDADDDMSFKCL